MSKVVNLGGDRIRSGGKMNVEMHGYDRSTFNLDKIFRTSTNCGVITPCYVNIGLNGDSFDININELTRTLPTNGPLMGKFKLQCDFFVAPIRLYNGLLHNNAIGIGMDMSSVKIPKIKLQTSASKDWQESEKNINPSSLLAYCGIRGLGYANTRDLQDKKEREFNALPILAYYDIFKNYYANKQEEQFPYINFDFGETMGFKNFTKAVGTPTEYIDEKTGQIYKAEELGNFEITPDYTALRPIQKIYRPVNNTVNPNWGLINKDADLKYSTVVWANDENAELAFDNPIGGFFGDVTTNQNGIILSITVADDKIAITDKAISEHKLIAFCTYQNNNYLLDLAKTRIEKKGNAYFFHILDYYYYNSSNTSNEINRYKSYAYDINGDKILFDGNTGATFTIKGVMNKIATDNDLNIVFRYADLKDIDTMREKLLNTSRGEVLFTNDLGLDFLTNLSRSDNFAGIGANSAVYNGLCVKTYQSDIFNNWLNSETIIGANGISAISAVKVEDGSFSIDSLNLAQKVYNMLNRIAVSGGTYEDWQEAVYDVEVTRRAETPYYVGGTSSMIQFDEVVSTADTQTPNGGDQPLGSLAGKGYSTQDKDNFISFKINEPSIIMGLLSITPIIDYSQGNKWFMTEINSLDDLHKPALDGIGFQDLMSENLDAESVLLESGNDGIWRPSVEQIAVGKQPAWIQYMTDINECFGDFAIPDKAMFMTLNRRFKTENGEIKDSTTYIDPTKYNYAFADISLSSQNFWVQLAFNIKARRKMSAKLIPNL